MKKWDPVGFCFSFRLKQSFLINKKNVFTDYEAEVEVVSEEMVEAPQKKTEEGGEEGEGDGANGEGGDGGGGEGGEEGGGMFAGCFFYIFATDYDIIK